MNIKSADGLLSTNASKMSVDLSVLVQGLAPDPRNLPHQYSDGCYTAVGELEQCCRFTIRFHISSLPKTNVVIKTVYG